MKIFGWGEEERSSANQHLLQALKTYWALNFSDSTREGVSIDALCLINPQRLHCRTWPANSAAPELHLTCKVLWKTNHIPQGPNKPVSPPSTC